MNLEIFRRLIGYTHGIIFVTGPTGSGKTTTLYARAGARSTPSRRTSSPSRTRSSTTSTGISQIQVSNKKGLTFASGLRSLMRQDPDVMMVGEIRDGETARIAVQAANTGHLVFSTLHTNDAPGAVTRMIDLGRRAVPGGLGGDRRDRPAARAADLPVLQGVLRPDATSAQLKELGIRPGELEEGSSCAARAASTASAAASTTGPRSTRSAMDEPVRDEIDRADQREQIKRTAFERGSETLRMDGADKVRPRAGPRWRRYSA